MGHKVSPLSNRLGINRTWVSRWYAKDGAFGLLLNEAFMALEKALFRYRQQVKV